MEKKIGSFKMTQRNNYELEVSILMEENHFKSDNPALTTGYRLLAEKVVLKNKGLFQLIRKFLSLVSSPEKPVFESCFLLKEDLLYLFKAKDFDELLEKSGEYFSNHDQFGFKKQHSYNLNGKETITINVFEFDSISRVQFCYYYTNGLLTKSIII